MCGLIGVWNKEYGFRKEDVIKLFRKAEERGQDAFGVAVWNGRTIDVIKIANKFSNVEEKIVNYFDRPNKAVILGVCRAQPETEVESLDDASIQPIVKEGLVLVHNGSVSNLSYKQLESVCGYQTKIDSEAILNAYIKYNGDMEKVMASLMGGFAFILLDTKIRRLLCVNDFKPLAIGYVRKYGLMVHSQVSAIQEVVEDITDCKRCGMNVWEDYYYHWQGGYTIRDIDLDSGMERIYSFEPNFYHPYWKKENKGRELVLVCASGGIDSGLSAWILRRINYDVRLMHFDYGQKGEEAERFAVMKLGDEYNFDYETFDLKDLFISDCSMLIKGGMKITTGQENFIKSTAAWVANRNGIFLSYLVTRAEQSILSNVYDKVYIVSGMSNLSEEGFYPDNSEYFIRSFFESVRYSTIVGDRIKYVPLLQNIMKAEEWLLGDRMKFPFQYTVSCDEPKLIQGLVKPYSIALCNQCGSTQLSKWAAEMAGVRDSRIFYDRDESEVMEKRFKGKTKKLDINDIVDRIKFIKVGDREEFKKGLCYV